MTRQEKCRLLQSLDFDLIKAEKCRRHYWTFVTEFWGTWSGDELVPNWHMQYLADTLQEVVFRTLHGLPAQDVLINCPPGSSKSSILTRMLHPWILTHSPNFSTISASYGYDLIEKLTYDSLKIIQHEKYKRFFPMVRLAKTAATNYQTTLGGERIICSAGSDIIGRHGSLITVDDMENYEAVQSNSERLRVQKWLKGDLSMRKKDKGTVSTVYCAQRLSFQDASSFLLENDPNIKYICLPADISDPEVAALVKPRALRQFYIDNLLDPVRMNRTIFPKILNDFNNSKLRFETEMNQNPTSQADSEIKRDWFRVISKKEFFELEKLNPSARTNFYLDSAFTDNTKNGKNDPSVILAVKTINNTMYLTGLFREFMDFPDLIRAIQSFTKASGYTNRSQIYIEPKASGHSVFQWLQKQTTLNVKEYRAPTESKRVRSEAASGSWEAGRVLLVEDAGWNNSFYDEVCVPWAVKKFYDILDTLTMGTEVEIIKGGKTTSASQFSF